MALFQPGTLQQNHKGLQSNFAIWRRVTDGNNRPPTPRRSPPPHNVQTEDFLCGQRSGNKEAMKGGVEGKMERGE